MTRALAASLFWIAGFFVLYTYVLYPLLVALLARLCPRGVARAPIQPSLSVVIAAHNEAANIEARVDDLLAQKYPPGRVGIIVASDGSTDATNEILARLAGLHPALRPILLDVNRGKAAALNAAVAAATGDIIVFADARQRFAPGVLARLAENFADPAVGSVSGELVLTDAASGVAANVGLYWRYELFLRRCESEFGSMLGATGAIYAIRRSLYRPLPEGALLDDFLTPMRIVLAGRRAILDGRALAFDRASSQGRQELRRKVRTLAGNFQAFAIEPAMLLPWRNRATWWQIWSHKLFRLLVPWALIVLLLAPLFAASPFYLSLAALQALFYLFALAGWIADRRGRAAGRLAGFAYTFTMLNAAAIAGLWAWATARGGRRIWRKAYSAPA